MGGQLIYESTNSKIFREETSEWGFPVVVKILNQEYPTPQNIRHFYNEYEITRDLDVPGIRRALRMGRQQNRHALIFPFVAGENARELIRRELFDIGVFLDVAIRAARILGNLHGHNIIHRDVSSVNLIIDPAGWSVNLIDFGISTRLDLKEQHLGNPERLEGNLSYISPEQTGRMNRVVDYRTDLYSLGVTLYELLTGRLPFERSDAMELVHAHLALTPAPAHELRPEAPPILSDILARLLAKNAEDRYQSAFGLMHDLQRCREAWRREGRVEVFPLGEKDYSGKFQIPQRLYGRDGELRRLMAAFDRVGGGARETLLVGGYSGTGKSALVHEIHRPITAKRGHFIEGKFDQFQRVVPYYAFLQAFRGFVAMLLTEREERLAELRIAIRQAVGGEGKVLTDVIPRLEHIIGPQPEVPEVGGAEAQNRFNYVFRKFVQAIATPEHPIVLFIDDLQWADSASLNLLRVLMTDPDGRCLLCICAYRDNEVEPSHPFITTVKEMEDLGATVGRIEIGNLSLADVQALTGEALMLPAPAVRPLARLVFDKTQGNAFFVTQFLKSLYQEQLLGFNFDTLRWEWDIERIRARNITDNVVELLAGKVQRLPAGTQEALRLAACIGAGFDLDTLALIRERTPAEVNAELQEALADGFIMPVEGEFKFVHDRIQQAVYSLIPEGERGRVHLRIGRLLLANIPEADQEDFLFDIVNQWNQGVDLIDDEADRERLAALNLRAGRKAKLSSAFKPAGEYIQSGIALLRPGHWQQQYELSRDLYTEAAETAYNTGDFDSMSDRIDAILRHGRDLLEKITPYAIRINAFKAQNRLQEAIDTGLDVLAQLGERFPKKGAAPLVMLDLLRTKWMLRGRDKDDLVNLPSMTNPYKEAAMRMLNDIASPAYWARPAILPFLIFRMVQLSLRYGNTAVSAFGYATYGLLMCGVLGAMREGYRFGQTGLDLLEKFQAKEWLSQIYTPIYALINHWNEHVHRSLEPFLYSYRVGFETGAIEYACINVNIYCNHLYLGGKPLPRTEEEMRAFSQRMLEYKQETNYNYNEAYRQAVLNLLGRSADPLRLIGEAYDEERMARQNQEREDRAGAFLIHFHRLILSYLFHDYETAHEQAALTRPLLDAVLAKYDVPVFWFYEGLTCLALAGERRGADRRPLLRRARRNIRRFRGWARYAPENHQHKLRLLEAEYQRVRRRPDRARDAYDEAIRLAGEHQFLNEEALACERAALFYQSTGAGSLAEHFLKRAYQTYREWGAEAKLRDLQTRHPQLVAGLRRERKSPTLSATTETTTLSDGSALDLHTVLKASTALSGEIVLARLLETLMRIVIENAGAQRGLLLLPAEDGNLVIQAEGSVGQDQVKVVRQNSAGAGNRLPESVVQYVSRTLEPLVLVNAASDERFNMDPYIADAQLRALLCLPILNQGQLTGLLYLENNLAEGAFTHDRTELLKLLSGQIAISIANARLYETLEEKVRERTAEVVLQKEKVEETLEQLKATQAQLVQSEKMASLGLLTAGIAHEINNPINFVTSSVEALKVDFAELRELIEKYRAVTTSAPELREAHAFAERVDVDFLFDEVGQLIAGVEEGAKRTSEIVAGLRVFSRLDEDALKRADLHEGLDSTLTLLGSQLRNHIRVHRDYGVLPPVECLPGKINQVFMNVLTNAIQAIEEGQGLSVHEGDIFITTRADGDQVEIAIRDTGAGMPPEVLTRIFEPFFTTKEVGKGTGLGLSISYGIIQQHGGTIRAESVQGAGSTFFITLPVKQG